MITSGVPLPDVDLLDPLAGRPYWLQSGGMVQHKSTASIATTSEPMVSDRVVRVVHPSGATFPTIVATMPTAAIRAAMLDQWSLHEREINALKQVAVWQREKLEYNAIYTAYLLGAISDDEFDKESDRFVVEESDEIDVPSVAQQITTINRLLPFAIPTSDLSELFRCSTGKVLEAIRSIEGVRGRLEYLVPEPPAE